MDDDFSGDYRRDPRDSGGFPADRGAYGASGATGRFDPYVFIKKPQVILRLISLLFAIIVFSCISSRGYDARLVKGEHPVCWYNGDGNACGFGIAIGVIAFIILIVFLIFDSQFDNMSNVVQRKYVVIADIVVSGLWTFFWFVCFCYLTDQWRHTPKDFGEEWGSSAAEATIAFSFFSIGTFAAITVLAVLRYRQGVDQGITGYEPDPYGSPDSLPPS